MKTFARGLLVIVALFILMSGLTAMFAPERFATKMALQPQGAEGLSHFRAFLGASLTAIGLSVMMAAVTAEISHARPAVLFVIGIVVARAIGYFEDGPIPSLAVYVAVPMVVFGILLAAHRLLDRVHAEQAAKPN